MKTAYLSSFARVELSDDLLARVEGAELEIRSARNKTSGYPSVDIYLDSSTPPQFIGGAVGGLVIRVAYNNTRVKSRAVWDVVAGLGAYRESQTSLEPPYWRPEVHNEHFEPIDVRAMSDVYFNEYFVKSIYDGRSGLKDLQIVRKAHRGQLAEEIEKSAWAILNNPKVRPDKKEEAYLMRVAAAADKVSRGSSIKVLTKAIKTNPARKIWCRPGGGCCG